MRYARNRNVPVFITNKDELNTSDIITLMYEIETFDKKYEINSNYYYGINASSSLIFSTSGRISSFANNSNNGNSFDKCMVVTGNVGI